MLLIFLPQSTGWGLSQAVGSYLTVQYLAMGQKQLFLFWFEFLFCFVCLVLIKNNRNIFLPILEAGSSRSRPISSKASLLGWQTATFSETVVLINLLRHVLWIRI